MIDEVKHSLRNLMHRKTRSWLTVLSILIGIMAIFAIVSFGLGIQDYMDNLAEEAGTDKIYIQPRGTGAPGLDDTFYISEDEANFVSKIKGIDEVLAWYLGVGQITHKKETKYSFLAGIDPETPTEFLDEVFTVGVEKGRYLKKGDSNKVVLGYNYQIDNKFFKKGISLGDKVEINGEKFEVVGFYEEIGNPQDDTNIYLTFSAFERLNPDSEGKFGALIMKTSTGEDPGAIADKVEEKLRKFKGEEEGKETFFVQTFEDALEIFGNIINVLNGILVLIALISLIVASVNIMNTMYTAVLERTKEIGVMKSIGARNRTIFFLFALESGFLGAVGGLIGILFGYLIAKTGGNIAAASGYSLLKPIFPLYLSIGCVTFAFFVGLIAGILPAIQASKQKPVDALRYE